MTSTPNMAYQQNYSPVYPTHPLPPYPPPPPMSLGIDSVLKEMCQKHSNVETKLTKLDKIEERLEIMDKKFKTVDTEINSYKQRLNTLEHSAQFLSNILDAHKALKLKLDKITSGIESTTTESKNFNDKLIDIEVQSLEENLLFFAIDEHTVVENNPEIRGVKRE
jgi:chromosome segregation ATPase